MRYQGDRMNGAEISRKIYQVAAVLVLLLVVIAGGYMAVVLNWSYSKGDRIGFVQKFSEKGWLCKTWEGELQMLPIQGALPEKFLFSVRDKGIIAKINGSLGKKVAITYEQHKGIPTSCFGETEYFAVAVKVLE